jgi:hypothetical protein
MTESDKATATALVLRINGHLLVLTWLLVFVLAVLAGLLQALAGASIPAVGVAVSAALVLAASGLLTARALTRLSGFGYCGFWHHCAAVRVLCRQSVMLIVASLMTALAIWLA